MSARRSLGPGLLLAAIVLLALNLRGAIAAVGPVVADIREATRLGNTAIGLLTALPLLAFGLMSALTGVVTRRTGVEGGVLLALGLIGAGVLARAGPSVALLFGGTMLMGVGIALGNVLMPALARRYFPERVGGVTSIYSSTMGLGAALAAAVSAPIALAWGWQAALGIWAAPAALALIIWIPVRRATARTFDDAAAPRPPSRMRAVGRSRLAWQIAVFMGLQSLTFYVMVAWMPDLLQTRGFGPAGAGSAFAVSQAAGVLGTGAVPVLASRSADQTGIVWMLALAEAVSLLGFLLTGGLLLAFWAAVLGFVLGGTFGLALFLLAVRAPDTEASAELSGMAQSIGYLIAATGPTAFGLLYDASGGWTVPLVFLMVVLAGKLWTGARVGRPGLVVPGE